MGHFQLAAKYKFVKKHSDSPVYVAWWDYFADTGSSKTVLLHVGDIKKAKITEAVPNAESGAELDENGYPGFFKEETRDVNGELILELKETPVFVEQVQNVIIQPAQYLFHQPWSLLLIRDQKLMTVP